MKKKLASVIAFFAILFLISFVASAAGFSDKVKEFTLANGMKFLVYERHEVPTFAGVIMVKVGSADERKGETGMAHFIEHMAPKGTTVIGTKDFQKEKPILAEMDKIGNELAAEYLKGSSADKEKMKALREKLKKLQERHLPLLTKDGFSLIYNRNGGLLNASTSSDCTRYRVMLPANRLELWFLIESERFKELVFRQFYSERDVIAEERRQVLDNNPFGILYEEILHIAFLLHPYRHHTAGYMEDIQSYTMDKVVNFFKTFYIPNNMTAAIVGDVKLDDVKKLAEKYFEHLQRGPEPPRNKVIEPMQRGERRVTVRFDAEPIISIGYHKPAYPEKDNLTLSLIKTILSLGDSSRFMRDLVTNRKIAINISTYTDIPGERYPALFCIFGMPRHPNTVEQLEKAIYEHFERLKKEPVPKEEIEKALNMAEASLYRSQGKNENLSLAYRLLRNVIIYGDVDADFKIVEEMKKITPEDIMDTAKRIFDESNRSVVILLKKEKGGEQ